MLVDKLLESGGDLVEPTVTILDKVGEFIQTNAVYLFTAVAVLVGVWAFTQLLDRKKKKRR